MRSLIWLALAACGGGSGGHDGYYLAGECDPAAGTVPVTVTQVFIAEPSCLNETFSTQLDVVESVEQWDALFTCPTPVPSGLDLATQRAAVARVQCSPLSLHFVSESDAEVVVGVVTSVSGACISEPVVVPLARSAKPVRLAECHEQCDDCPPVP